MEYTLQQIANAIKEKKSVVIMTHMRPDGDALGGAMALSQALDFLKIPNQVCVEGGTPANLTFVQGMDKVKKHPEGEFDCLLLLDCSDEQRLGILCDDFLMTKRKKIDSFNIDHHVSNTRFAKYNFVRECSANCMNIALLIDELGVSIDKQIAEYLLIGLLTDSGNFSHDDVNGETFTLAAKLMDAGADIKYYHYNLFKKQSKVRAALYAQVMGKIRYYFDDRFAVIVITKRAMEERGANESMTEGFVDFPLSIDGVEIAAALMEVKPRQYKVSLRSKEYADVNKLAGRYGGGGHVRAAGCMLFGELEDVLDKLSYTASQYLED